MPRIGCTTEARTMFRKIAGFVVLLSVGLMGPAPASDGVRIPTSSHPNDVLVSLLSSLSRQSGLSFGAVASGANNVGPLFEIAEREQEPRLFSDTSGYATLEMTQWARLKTSGWWFSYVDVRHDSYEGNADAAQLWTDLHSHVQTKPAYAPVASGTRVAARWYGIGRVVPFRYGSIEGTVDVAVRRITVDDYLRRSVVGNVEGDSFSGMVRFISSRGAARYVEGRGWALDSVIRFQIPDRLAGQISVEGLLGRVAWRGLLVEDAYLVSPRVFLDPDGFLREFSGISGASWPRDESADIEPVYRLDLVFRGSPWVLAGVSYHRAHFSPNFGLCRPHSNHWGSYFRYYPKESRLELGAVGARWELRVSSDEWSFAEARRAEISVSFSPLRF